MSVDDVEVLVGQAVAERFAELELELREGDEVELEPLADMLAEIEELVAVESSKFERALEVVRREPREPRRRRRGAERGRATTEADVRHGRSGAQRRKRRKAAQAAAARGRSWRPDRAGCRAEAAARSRRVPTVTEAVVEAPRILVPKSPGVLADDHIAEAGRKVLRFHLARMVAREAGTREGKDAEELHAMRVATRRQRAAWRVFGDAFDAKRTARHRKRLRLVAADLGAVRDLDVLIESIEAYQRHQPESEAAALEPLVRSWRVRRETSRERPRPRARRRSLPALAGRLSRLRPDRGPGRPRRGPDRAAPRPRHDAVARVERVRGAPRLRAVMRWADVATLHELRIAAKWLRYTLEFVREALGRDAGPVIEKVVALQDHLGWLHDADVAAGLARGVPRRARRRPDRGRERGDRPLPRRSRADSWRRLRRTVGDAVARRVEPHVPTLAREARRGPLTG